MTENECRKILCYIPRKSDYLPYLSLGFYYDKDLLGKHVSTYNTNHNNYLIST